MAGLSQRRMNAIRGNLMDDSAALAGPDYYDFDLAVVSMALHHVKNPQELLMRLVERLKSGGVLVVIEWLPPSASAAEETPVQGGSEGRGHAEHTHGAHSAGMS